jgi:hypothetical protein
MSQLTQQMDYSTSLTSQVKQRHFAATASGKTTKAMTDQTIGSQKMKSSVTVHDNHFYNTSLT